MLSPDRTVFALDVPDESTALGLVERLKGHVGYFKVGLELFVSCGPSILKRIDAPVILDLKLHDIPETVERTVKSIRDMGVKALTIHVQQRKTMEKALAAAGGSLRLIGVTVLTSMIDQDIYDLNGFMLQPRDLVHGRADLAWSCGINSFVCSPEEVSAIRRRGGAQIFLMVPGIRARDSVVVDDQQRVGTPYTTILEGADLLVVGRPIRDAKDPVAAADAIAAEVWLAEQEMRTWQR